MQTWKIDGQEYTSKEDVVKCIIHKVAQAECSTNTIVEEPLPKKKKAYSKDEIFALIKNAFPSLQDDSVLEKTVLY